VSEKIVDLSSARRAAPRDNSINVGLSRFVSSSPLEFFLHQAVSGKMTARCRRAKQITSGLVQFVSSPLLEPTPHHRDVAVGRAFDWARAAFLMTARCGLQKIAIGLAHFVSLWLEQIVVWATPLASLNGCVLEFLRQ
jgi:hypothetical protein